MVSIVCNTRASTNTALRLGYRSVLPVQSVSYRLCFFTHRRGHEILVRSGGFALGPKAGREAGHVVHDMFVCIPASMDEAVRLALGVAPKMMR